MKIGVISTYLNTLGGAERTTISLVEALENKGHDVTLYCSGGVNNEDIARIFGKKINAKIVNTITFNLPLFGIYQNLINHSLVRFYRKKNELLIDISGTILPLWFGKIPEITYCHFPVTAELDRAGKYKHGFWKAYFLPFYGIVNSATKNLRKTRLLANSHFTARWCKKVWGIYPEVVYPPVEINKWKNDIPFDKKQDIVSVSRFSQEKNQLLQVRVMERLQKMGREEKLHMIGTARTPSSKIMLNKIKTEINRLGLKNIIIHENIPFRRLIENVSKAKVFVHSMVDEPFGLVIVEAMSSGCIPIVHNSGGAPEIVPFPQLRYNDIDDFALKLVETLDGKNDHLAPKFPEIAKRFSEDVFQKRMIEIIDEVKKGH
jgi:glycosyltransferase involved in cell wall biosynthesis